MHPLRLGMKTPSARRQAVLRAVGEENRALSAAAEARSHGGQRSRIRPTPASGRLLRGGRLGAVVLVVSLVAGLIVFNPAVTDLSAGWVETPPVARQHDHGGFSARRVSVIAPDRLADPGSTAVFPFDAFPPLTVLQESPALSEYGPHAAPDSGLGRAFDEAPGEGLSTPVDAMPITSLFGLNVRTIVVDAGHGGVDPGAVGAQGTREKDITLDVARRLARRLERGARYRVVLTRSGDETVSLARRVELANAADADLFVSIHVNALPNRHVNVIETYHFDFSEDPAVLQLAAIENRDSGMPVGYFRTLLEKIGDTVKLEESRALARHIQTSMINNVRNHDAGVFDSGVKKAPFVVLMGVGVPAVLVEISCISNRNEEMKLRTPQYREKIASFLEEGITTYLDHRQLQARGPAHHEREDASESTNRHRQGG
jgi:N-acetylmuramoyl-L-alanine amidase